GASELLGSLWRNRNLTYQLTRRDVIGRYRGSVVGIAWSFFNPMLMLAVYTFVFSVIFKSRWSSTSGDSHIGFAIVLFVGMIVHGLLAECINKAPGIILSNANYVKRVIFPLEILPSVAVGTSLFHAAISVLVLFCAELLVGHGVPWTAVFIPVVLAPLLGVALGFSWFISATSVYVRDITQMTGIFTAALMFLAPVFYPITAIPEQYRRLLYLNPLTFIIEQSREVLINGRLPDWQGLVLYAIASATFAWMGFWWFQRTRRGFSDVI
ncbi:MAG: ABC transporter permease, partial [Pseudoxanthomonas sp.]